MRTGLQKHNLAGNVRSVETTLIGVSTTSYRLRPNGREQFEDFVNPSKASSGSPLLWEVLKFDAVGKLVEDIDVERPLIEQDSYRYVYTYNQQGLLVERAGYSENGSSDGRTEYTYDPGGKKTKELIYSSDGRVQARYEFDEQENFTSVEWFKEDGTVREKQTHRYEYLSKGNTLEQIYYPPEMPTGVGFYTPLKADTEKVATLPTPPRLRTVVARDDAGHLREQSRYYVDGSLHERKVFDQRGILRSTEWRVGEEDVSITLCDERGRAVEAHTIAKMGVLSTRAVDDRTLFSYDEHGNLESMVTSGPGGSLVRKTTNAFVYDGLGNWIEKTEVQLDNTWQTEPFPAAFETIRQFHRTISYFPEN